MSKRKPLYLAIAEEKFQLAYRHNPEYYNHINDLLTQAAEHVENADLERERTSYLAVREHLKTAREMQDAEHAAPALNQLKGILIRRNEAILLEQLAEKDKQNAALERQLKARYTGERSKDDDRLIKSLELALQKQKVRRRLQRTAINEDQATYVNTLTKQMAVLSAQVEQLTKENKALNRTKGLPASSSFSGQTSKSPSPESSPSPPPTSVPRAQSMVEQTRKQVAKKHVRIATPETNGIHH